MATAAQNGGADRESELKNGSYEVFILALSVLSIVNIALAAFIPLPDTRQVIVVIDIVLSIIFLGDFTYRLFSAPTKRRYFVHQRGWLDLLSSLPLPQVKVFRLFRVVRVVRLLREVGPSRFLEKVTQDRAGSALLVVVFLAILLLQFGAVLMLAVEERAPDGNIKDASDALWYVYVTVTTVGYGDRFPVTNAGRVIGVVTMTIGVGLFGTLTGFLANAFVNPGQSAGDGDATPAGDAVPAGDIAALRAELAAIRRQLQALQAPAPPRTAEPPLVVPAGEQPGSAG